MRQIDSPVLQQVHKTLRIGRAPENTLFDERSVRQVLDVAPLIRRGGTIAPSEGLYTLAFTNNHAAANEQTTSVDLYELATPNESFPSPVPAGFEIWLIQYQVALSADTLDAAIFRYSFPGDRSANTGNAVPMIVAAFGTAAASMGATAGLFAKEEGSGAIIARNPVRLPRGVDLEFTTDSAGVLTAIGRAFLALLPAGLGQDVVA